jgi:hypothetical protein
VDEVVGSVVVGRVVQHSTWACSSRSSDSSNSETKRVGIGMDMVSE